MSALVDDLLTMAALDDERPLELNALDLSQLLRDIASDANAVQPDRPIGAIHDRHPPVRPGDH